MFNFDELETTLEMWRNKNHIELLIRIREAEMIPTGYAKFLDESIEYAVTEYLDTYGHTKEMN